MKIVAHILDSVIGNLGCLLRFHGLSELTTEFLLELSLALLNLVSMDIGEVREPIHRTVMLIVLNNNVPFSLNILDVPVDELLFGLSTLNFDLSEFGLLLVVLLDFNLLFTDPCFAISMLLELFICDFHLVFKFDVFSCFHSGFTQEMSSLALGFLEEELFEGLFAQELVFGKFVHHRLVHGRGRLTELVLGVVFQTQT